MTATSSGRPASTCLPRPRSGRAYRADVSRLPYLRRDDLSDSGQAVWDSITKTRGDAVVNAEGGLIGPFNAWLFAPDVGSRLADLGATLRFGTSVDRLLLELAIITVGAYWKAEFEWWAHSRMAREHGVAAEVGRLMPVARSRSPSSRLSASSMAASSTVTKDGFIAW